MSHGKPDYFSTSQSFDVTGVHGGDNVPFITSGQPQMFRVNVAASLNNVSGNALTATFQVQYANNGVGTVTEIFTLTLNSVGHVAGGGTIVIWNDTFDTFFVEGAVVGSGPLDLFDMHIVVEGM